MTDNYREISAARQALRDGYQNLQNVAEYCEKNYMEAPDKRKALESTMALVTQTLASVVSQVGTTAKYISDMLEEQSQVLLKEEAKVRFVSQFLDIHVEKVSRRKIGSLTVSKRFPRTQKIVYGESKEPQSTYTRNPINLSCLDNTGHGLMDSETQQLSKTGTMSRKISVKSMGQAQNSFGRSCRIKDPVAAPVVPDMFPCPEIPNGTSSSIPNSPSVNSDPPFPPLPALFEHCDPSVDERQITGSDSCGFHFSPTDNIDDFLPPPPDLDCGILDIRWPKVNGSQMSSYISADDFLPPPPAPGYEITDSYWSPGNVGRAHYPGERGHCHQGIPFPLRGVLGQQQGLAPDVPAWPPSLDDLPPPPDC